MRFGREDAVFINSGPSLDRLASAAWEAIGMAGEVIAVNGALVAETCRAHGVRFTAAVAMDAGVGPARGLDLIVPGFRAAWRGTTAWRITKAAPGVVAAETYVRLVEDQWCDDPDSGYAGGGSAASACNWFANDWPDESERHRLSALAGKRAPRRGYRRFAFLGLDMIPGRGEHARGAGTHRSGFASCPERDRWIRERWKLLGEAAAARGIEVINYSPGTGLEEMPRGELPGPWVIG
jgi:hypothetical protein